MPIGKFDREKAWSNFRVGLVGFIALSLLVIGITFAGGDKGLLFQKTAVLKAELVDVSGLKKGSSVTMSGMPIGKLTDIAFVDDLEKNRMEVTMLIRSNARKLIKVDSIPSVRTQGMMGDRFIDISRGGQGSQVLPDGKALVGSETTDFDETLHQASAVLNETHKVLNAVNQQQGTVGQHFYDEKFYARLIQIADQVNELIKDFKQHPRKYIKFSLF